MSFRCQFEPFLCLWLFGASPRRHGNEPLLRHDDSPSLGPVVIRPHSCDSAALSLSISFYGFYFTASAFLRCLAEMLSDGLMDGCFPGQYVRDFYSEILF